jgi:hypothetical protein
MLAPPSKTNGKVCPYRHQCSSIHYYDGFELLELPALDLPELESFAEEPDEALLEEDEDSEVEAAGLLLPESDLPSEAAADMSDFPSDLPAESAEDAVLLPDFA